MGSQYWNKKTTAGCSRCEGRIWRFQNLYKL